MRAVVAGSLRPAKAAEGRRRRVLLPRPIEPPHSDRAGEYRENAPSAERYVLTWAPADASRVVGKKRFPWNRCPGPHCGVGARAGRAMTFLAFRKPLVLGGARTVVTIVVLVALYWLLPFDHRPESRVIGELLAGLLLLFLIVLRQVRVIARHDYPGVRAIEALAFTIPLYLLLSTTTYYLMARTHPASFNEHLSRMDALYFCVTVFSKSCSARSVRSILSAVKRGQDRRPSHGRQQTDTDRVLDLPPGVTR